MANLYTILLIYFNPRSHEGSDPECAGVDFEIQISIRAPTRGATLPPNPNPLPVPFQSALPRGERLMFCLVMHLSSRFQSALPRGERLHS